GGERLVGHVHRREPLEAPVDPDDRPGRVRGHPQIVGHGLELGPDLARPAGRHTDRALDGLVVLLDEPEGRLAARDRAGVRCEAEALLTAEDGGVGGLAGGGDLAARPRVDDVALAALALGALCAGAGCWRGRLSGRGAPGPVVGAVTVPAGRRLRGGPIAALGVVAVGAVALGVLAFGVLAFGVLALTLPVTVVAF